MPLTPGTYNNQKGWFDSSTNEFLPASQWQSGSANGKKGIFNSKTNEFIETSAVQAKQDKDRGFIDRLVRPAKRGAANYSSEPIPTKESMKQSAPLVRNFLQLGGLATGAAATSPIPGAPIVGAGVGYAGANRLADVYDAIVGANTKDRSSGEILTDTAKDVGIGSAIQATGTLAGKGLKYVGEKIAPFAEKVYGSAIKTPLTRKWTRTLPGEDISQRTRVVRKGIEERVPPSEYGAAKAKHGEAQAKRAVDAEVAKLNTPIRTDDLLQDGLEEAYKRAGNSENPARARAMINRWASSFSKGHGSEVTPEKAEAIKRELYKNINWNESWAKELLASARKGVAHEYMVALERLNPELKALNQSDAAWIGLRDAIERALARNSNRDLVGLGTKVLLNKSWATSIMDATIGHPQIKARLAFALNKAGRLSGKPLNKTARVAGTVSYPNNHKEE